MNEPRLHAKRRRNGQIIEEWDEPLRWFNDDPRFAERSQRHNDHIRLHLEGKGVSTIWLQWKSDRVLAYGWHFDLVRQKAKHREIAFRPILADGSLGGLGIVSENEGRYIETEDCCGIIQGNGIDDLQMMCWIKEGRDGSGDWKHVMKPEFQI